MALRLNLNPQSPEPQVLKRAKELLEAGEIVAYPTETFYGLGVRALKEEALRKLVCLKGRPEKKPFPLIIPDLSWAERLWEEVSPPLKRLMECFWPGPLTLVARAKEGLPPEITGPKRTVALRISSHPVAQALVETLGEPITATSANPSGAPPPRLAQEVEAFFGRSLALILDAGETQGGLASTLALVEGEKVTILRQGPISINELMACLK